ncbi:MAG: GntR family transcriptional regulator [Burkholderiaceae bacterium]
MVSPAVKPRLASAVRKALKRGLPEAALYETVAEHLRQRILKHQLGPGSWIDEQALCLELGISRTPLREALKVLASEGLVTMKLRRGAYVTEVSARDLTEVFHLLALLEGDAAAKVAREASAEQLAELEGLHRELEANTADRDRFFAANERFHLHLLDLADNRWGKQVAADLRKVMKLSRHHSLFKQGRVEASLTEHRNILAALLARDARQAQRLMREHIAKGEEAAREPSAA